MWAISEDEWLHLNVEAAANSPSAWSFKAHRLRAAADILPFTEVWTVRYLLLGLAVEAGLKGLAIARGHRIEITAAGQVKHGWKGHDGHDLVQLAELARFDIDDIERSLLQKLVTFVRWGAKYPVPGRVGHLGLEGTTDELDLADRVLNRLFRDLTPLVQAADRKRTADRRAAMSELARPVLQWENGQATSSPRPDGAVLLRDPDGTYPHDLDSGTSALACVSSHTSLELSRDCPAARCRDGHLHFLAPHWDPARDEVMNSAEMLDETE